MALSDHLPASLRCLLQPLQPFAHAASLWSGAGGMRMSAAMSFYGILSLAPLLLLLVGVLGWWMDREVLEKGLLGQVGTVVGERGAAVLSDALKSAKEPAEGIAASIAGFVVLLFGATGVFGELQEAFQQLWHGKDTPEGKPRWWHAASLRLRGVGYILVFGFLLLVSLMISALLNLFSGWVGAGLAMETVFKIVNEMVAFGICAALFVGLMRLSGGRKPGTRFLVVGAVVGATLFTMGRQGMTIYLSSAAVVSSYGAAGSLIVLLMWIYFSSAVLLFGAACAKALEQAALLRRDTADPQAAQVPYPAAPHAPSAQAPVKKRPPMAAPARLRANRSTWLSAATRSR